MKSIKSKDIKALEIQIKSVIPLLEKQYIKTPTSMLDLIIKRYKNAADIIENNDSNNIDDRQLHIVGSVKAYLDSASDYTNPMLEEMYKAENLFEQAFRLTKN